MTATQRIFLNILATYGRSLFALACGLFTSRWILMALGASDYGLYGVVGGLTVFIAFFNGLLAGAISRFYAINIGKASNNETHIEGLIECRKWFNTALIIHTIVPLILIFIGYPIGIWLIHNWLTIPPDRVEACVWVFRYVCITCFIGMVNVPFTAMYQAKQYIAELTIYSFITTILNTLFLYYIASHPGDWLARYAFYTMLISVIPQVFICYRAIKIFPECKICPQYFFNGKRLEALFIYTIWQFFGNAGGIVRSQGITLLINKQLGSVINGTMAIANNLASKTDTLSAALTGAFSPAIVTLEGSGNHDKMLQMACRSSKFGALLCLIFLLPLSLETNTILVLWLKNPPPLTAEACLFTLAIILIDQFSRGVNIAINASGKVALFNCCIGSMHVLSLPVAIIVVVYFNGGLLSILEVLVVFKIIGVILGAIIAHFATEFPIWQWVKGIILPILFTSLICLLSGNVIKWLLNDFFFIRMGCAFVVMEIILAFCAWRLVFDQVERDFLQLRFQQNFIKKLKGFIK